ncbi:MAG: hypothetical protein CL933_15245 [Deltaproteobacteria bacterium]|nr:hypothetical protein [Deltaproteobacteria bacterium]
MSVSEGPQAESGTPGLSQLGVRMLVGALMVVAALLLAQQWGAGDRRERKSFALVSGTIRLSDLAAPIEILRDDRGIPHLISRREMDGWFALGFVHAQDRLAQMASFRRRAMGTSAELNGVASLPADRLARLLEIGRASHAALDALPAFSRRVLAAYAAGVNARIARIRQGRVGPPQPLEGGLETLDDWHPADSIAVVKLLSWCMGGTLETTLLLDDLIQRLDSVPARPFFPGRASVDFGVAPDIPRHALSSEGSSGAMAKALLGSTRALCRGIGIPSGGAWVLDGSKSESGAPILVADWHFDASVPGLFYEAHLVAGNLEVAGATMPGSPILWAGRNRSFAWASVPASAPISDLFIETLREDRGLYQNGTLWVPLETREEKLFWRDARGALQLSVMSIRSTRHGPLIDALWNSEGGNEASAQSDSVGRHRSARAIAWTGARPGDGLTSMLALLRLESAAGVVSALTAHHEPVLALAFADQAGNGGVQVAGWLPNRPLPTGLVPVQGRLRSFDWRSPVPIEALPGDALGGRKRPWVMALDQPWSDRGGLDQIEWLWRPGDRAARLDTALGRLTASAKLDLRAAAEILQDERAQRAPRIVAAIVGMARRPGPLSAEAEEIATLLERWDGGMEADSAAAAAYHLVIEHLLEGLLRDPFGSALFDRYLAAPHVRPQSAVERLLLRAAKLRRSGGWTDEERVTKAARRSLRSAWVSLNHRLGPTRDRWAWGELHRLQFTSLGRGSAATFDGIRSLAVPGSGQTLAFARHRPGLRFQVEGAALYRVAMDLGAPDRLLSSLAPGQTEHPGHPHSTDGIARWAASRLSLFATNRLVIEEENIERLVLEPAP